MRPILCLALVLAAPVLASAQSIDVFGITGAVQVWNDESNIGLGVPVGAGIGFRSPFGWGVEALVERQNVERRFTSGVRFDSTVMAARARFLKYFGREGIQPYAGGGFGVTRVETSRTEPPGFGGVFSSEATSGTLSGVAGVRIPAGRRLFVRPEFEISRAGEHTRIGGNAVVGLGW